MDAAATPSFPKITGWQANLAFEAVDDAKGRWYQFWHFDRHPGGNVPLEVHPLYHANFGGGKLEACRQVMPMTSSKG